ncbi:SDR family NAD(P)-dependent oxidoreductase [Mycolicibacterium hippocampi]|nr:SDR family NAD(P)-dependent oxidoreductase [Mycolicibacterium hippocampi]
MTSQWSPARLGDMTGKRIIVTGATNGVGLATASALARAGAHVILAVRNLELGAQRAAEMGGDTSIVKLDLADQSSVKAFPGLVDGDVDVLINNAGLVAQHRSDTVDGFEMTMGTNFLGPFALTNLMFGRVRSKIVNVGSDAHKSASIAFDDPHLRTRKWSSFPAYARSKLAVMLWGLELDRRLREAGSPVTTYLTHPGWVASNLPNLSDTRMMSAFHSVVTSVANVIGNDLDAGAAPTLYCLTEPIPPGSYVGIDGRLGFKGGPTLSGRAPVACDYEDARTLWEFAERETGTTLGI